MDKKPLIRKGLVVGIILLFVGVIIAPAINFQVVKAYQEDGLIEVTTRACGIQGYEDTTVKLTREQYQQLEEYLVELRERLNQTSTRAEAAPIFKQAVVELNKYGLLPKGMSVSDAQRLVIGGTQRIGLEHIMKNTVMRNQLNASDTENFLCLVYGSVVNSYSVGPIFSLLQKFNWLTLKSLDVLGQIIDHLLIHNPLLGALLYLVTYIIFAPIFTPIFIFNLIILVPYLIGLLITDSQPINLLHTITIGGVSYNFFHYGHELVPGIGHVDTFGLNGKKSLQNDSLFGALPVPQNEILFFFATAFPGIMGFTGLHFDTYNHTFERSLHYYLGSALWVKIDTEPPQVKSKI